MGKEVGVWIKFTRERFILISVIHDETNLVEVIKRLKIFWVRTRDGEGEI